MEVTMNFWRKPLLHIKKSVDIHEKNIIYINYYEFYFV